MGPRTKVCAIRGRKTLAKKLYRDKKKEITNEDAGSNEDDFMSEEDVEDNVTKIINKSTKVNEEKQKRRKPTKLSDGDDFVSEEEVEDNVAKRTKKWMIFVPNRMDDHFFATVINFGKKKLQYLDNRNYDDPAAYTYAVEIVRERMSVFLEKYNHPVLLTF